MKRRRISESMLGLCLMCLCILCAGGRKVHAATSYTNAKEFYESTGQENGKHVEISEGNIYFAICARQAASSSNLKYRAVGYDIQLSAGRKTLNISMARGKEDVGMQEVSEATVESGGYMYDLYCVSSKRIYEYAYAKYGAEAEDVVRSSEIAVKIDAIVTTGQNGNAHGGVTEDGAGGVTEWGSVYRMVSDADWESLKKIFAGHDFKTYRDIEDTIFNYPLQIRYHLGGGNIPSESNHRYESVRDELYCNGAPLTTVGSVLLPVRLEDTDKIKLYKTGYHLETGKEWMYDGHAFGAGEMYDSKRICSDIGRREYSIFMDANWKPNRYRIRYHANGGNGRMSVMAMTYDIPARLQKNAFDREGYVFQGWSYKKEAVTPDFTDRQEVLNLVEEEQQEISLYAVWEPRVYKITANQQRGSGGTEAFFEKFGIGWYGNRETTQAITGITIPARAGYDFRGYHTGIAGLGEKIVNGSGKILAPATRFVENNVIYAYWVPKNYTIIFDKQGGSGGSDRAAAAYQKALPLVDSKGAKLWAPTRKGYTFQGYYTEADGRGSQYYTAYMSGNRNYSLDRDLTLYAYWVDEEPPEVTMSQTPGIPVTTGVEAEAQGWTTEWSKSPVKLTVAAKDAGSGVDAVFLYVKGTDGRYVPAKDSSGRDMAFTGLSSSAPCHTYQFEYVKPTEGVVNYMALAIDGAGHSSPACYLTVKTDYTPPRGTVTDNAVNENGDGIWELEGKMWNIELDLWDYKVQ